MNRKAPTLPTNKDIVKAPPVQPQQQERAIPKQYSANTATVETKDEATDTFMSVIHSLNNLRTVRASLHHLQHFHQVPEHLVISNTGADSHVAGSAWLPLYDPKGPCVPKVNVVGYNEHTTRQNGLPVGPMCTKVQVQGEQTKFLHGYEMISNPSSNHTLVNPFQMREAGLMVDDVSKKHLKTLDEYGTQCIKTTNDEHIDLKIRAALPTFTVTRPSM